MLKEKCRELVMSFTMLLALTEFRKQIRPFAKPKPDSVSFEFSDCWVEIARSLEPLSIYRNSKGS
jgi:hypothetical protein